MKRITALLMTVLMVLSLCACGQAETKKEEEAGTVSFTDSLGRTVEVPAKPEKLAPSGSYAQLVLYALCPDLLAGVTSDWDDNELPFIPDEMKSLPVLGQLYGGKKELNLETLMNSGAQVVVDVGQAKKDAAAELDALQEQTGVPFVHISADLSTMDETYDLLGKLTGRTEKAAQLSSYCRETYDKMAALADRVDKVSLLYITGDEGHNVIAKDSYHSEVIDLLGDNLAVVDEPSSKGSGNEVSMEQILLWDPEVLVFSPESIYDSVASDPLWSGMQAVQNGRVYRTPLGPYNWMGFPPSVQRYLGMVWLGSVLYPDECGYELKDEVGKYFELFYGVKDVPFDDLVKQ